METEEKDEVSSLASPEEPGEQVSIVDKAEEDSVDKTSVPGETKARLVIGGVVAATIVFIVAVVVTGIFQFVSNWVSCKQNLSLSDPARTHWSELASEKTSMAPTGVPRELESLVSLKRLSGSTKDGGQE